jgi:hypothetical protein
LTNFFYFGEKNHQLFLITNLEDENQSIKQTNKQTNKPCHASNYEIDFSNDLKVSSSSIFFLQILLFSEQFFGNFKKVKIN